MCDMDMRPAMWGSVVVTGGGTLSSGWAERLARDLSSRTPSSVRLKTIAANGSAERRFGAWIGESTEQINNQPPVYLFKKILFLYA